MAERAKSRSKKASAEPLSIETALLGPMVLRELAGWAKELGCAVAPWDTNALPPECRIVAEYAALDVNSIAGAIADNPDHEGAFSLTPAYPGKDEDPALAHVEGRLARGVYERGPRKGQPFDRRKRKELEDRATYYRAEIAKQRARIPRLLGEKPEASA